MIALGNPSDLALAIDAIAFGQQADALPRSGPARLLYRLDVNRFRGHESCQLMVERIVRSDS